MPGRSYSSGGKYRYGFNGKENDKDISEGGQDYGMRIFDRRLGRFLSVDPLTKEYPWNSTYAFAEDDPINYIDLEGMEKGKSKSTEGKGSIMPHSVQIRLTSNEILAYYNSNFNKNGDIRLSFNYVRAVIQEEGLATKMYDRDGGWEYNGRDNATIGIGHLIHYGPIGNANYENGAVGKEQPFVNGLSTGQVFDLFRSDVLSKTNAFESDVKSITGKDASELPTNVYEMFFDIHFNSGNAKKSLAQYAKEGIEPFQGSQKAVSKKRGDFREGLANGVYPEFTDPKSSIKVIKQSSGGAPSPLGDIELIPQATTPAPASTATKNPATKG
jgi:RHS repeat-associated protein